MAYISFGNIYVIRQTTKLKPSPNCQIKATTKYTTYVVYPLGYIIYNNMLLCIQAWLYTEVYKITLCFSSVNTLFKMIWLWV